MKIQNSNAIGALVADGDGQPVQSSRPLVSIGMPVYNGEKYLDGALHSVLTQTYPEIELIICDNASKDATQEICLRHAELDPRIRYFRNETNIGGANNHNLCFEHAKGKYFRWAASDDVLGPELIEKSVDILERNPHVVLCCSDCVLVDQWLVPEDTYACVSGSASDAFERFVQLVGHHYCYEACGLMRRDAMAETGAFRNYPDSDRAFLAHMGLLGEFHRIAEPLFKKRRHPGMSTQTYPDDYDRYAWYGERYKDSLAPPHLLQCFHLLEIIASSPIPILTKLKCYRHMATWLVARRGAFALEIPRFWRRLLGKDKAPSAAPR